MNGSAIPDVPGGGHDSLHDVPSASDLLSAVREWLERDVLAGTSGRLQFHARVAINILAMVGREIELGADQTTAHLERLASLGFATDAGLAAAIRSGELDDRLAEVIDVIRADVHDKLAVANPAYFIVD